MKVAPVVEPLLKKPYKRCILSTGCVQDAMTKVLTCFSQLATGRWDTWLGLLVLRYLHGGHCESNASTKGDPQEGARDWDICTSFPPQLLMTSAKLSIQERGPHPFTRPFGSLLGRHLTPALRSHASNMLASRGRRLRSGVFREGGVAQ